MDLHDYMLEYIVLPDELYNVIGFSRKFAFRRLSTKIYGRIRFNNSIFHSKNLSDKTGFIILVLKLLSISKWKLNA